MSLDVGAATRTVITLRARFCGAPPRPGELMAAETGPAVYRVESVTILRQAGEQPGTHRYRLTCTRLASAEADAAIHPWRWGGRAPRQTALQAPAGVSSPARTATGLRARAWRRQRCCQTPQSIPGAGVAVRRVRRRYRPRRG